MGEATAEVMIAADLKEVWDLYFDPERWAMWVDGFARVEASEGYPERGGTLRWQSIPAGRGLVVEEVLDHEPRRRHRVSFEDPESTGELEATFEIRGEQVHLTQRMTYKIRHPGILGPLTDVFFVRRQVAGSLARSLGRLKHEAEAG
jgi:uncharacterized protein YndB with AHSA1/START domain